LHIDSTVANIRLPIPSEAYIKHILCYTIHVFLYPKAYYGLEVMVFNVTFKNISAIAWRSVLLVEENGIPDENYRQVASH
jgi:hypothetical protein